MGYRCRDACGLAAAAVAKVSGIPVRVDERGEDEDSTGDVELGEFYSGKPPLCDPVAGWIQGPASYLVWTCSHGSP